MIEVTINQPDGTALATIDLPSNFSEVTLQQYISFFVALRDYREAGANEAAIMARAVAEFIGADPVELLQAKMGGEYDQIALDSSASVSALFSYILKMLQAYKPKFRAGADAVFIYKGERFVLSHQSVLAGAGIKKDSMNVLETVEVFEVKRLVSEAIKRDGDPSGSLWFSQYLNVLAILARKENEPLPFDDAARAEFIAERRAFFVDITADIALDVDFFLTTGLLLSNQTPHLIGSLTLQALQILAIHQKRPKQSVKPSHSLRPLRGGRAGAGSRLKSQKKVGFKDRN